MTRRDQKKRGKGVDFIFLRPPHRGEKKSEGPTLFKTATLCVTRHRVQCASQARPRLAPALRLRLSACAYASPPPPPPISASASASASPPRASASPLRSAPASLPRASRLQPRLLATTVHGGGGLGPLSKCRPPRHTDQRGHFLPDFSPISPRFYSPRFLPGKLIN